MARPPMLVVFGALFILLPLFNYFRLTYEAGISWQHPALLFEVLDPVALTLLLLPLPVGIGLLLVRTWGWWLFLFFAALLITYNAVLLIFEPGISRAWTMFESILGIAAVFYFLRTDISAPYMKVYPRGWRMQRRHPIHTEVTVAGHAVQSASGRLTLP